MSEYQPSDIRISDSEREDALGKLGEHMSAGRLDIDEYGERTARVTAAKTRGQLLDLFGDLPEPRPVFGRPAPPAEPVGRAPSVARKVAPVLVPVVFVVLAFSLMFLVKVPFVILLLPFLFFVVSGSRWRGHQHQRYDDHRRAMRDQHMRREQQWRRWRDERY